MALSRDLGLPLAILRPSLVSSVAYEPYAGFTGNYAGHVGACMAYLVGLYNDQVRGGARDRLGVGRGGSGGGGVSLWCIYDL